MASSSSTSSALKQLVGRIKVVGQQAQCYFTTAAPAGSNMVFPTGRSLEVSQQDVSFRMPAEYEPHTGCWVAWPKRPDVWRAQRRPAIKAFKEVIAAISQFEPVTVIAIKDQWLEAREELPDDVRVLEVTIDDSWVRDSGPTFVYAELGSCPKPTIRALVGNDWRFNGWGGLYGTWDNDNIVARKICEAEGKPYVSVDMVLEGGSIHVDGEGTLLTTEECLLNPNRNPNLSKSEIGDRLKQHLGVTKIIWLPKGLYKDEDTNGHIDNFACFARPGVVLLAWTDDESDPQHAISKEALEILSAETDAKGRKLQVVKLPNPRPLFRTQEELDTLEGEGLSERHAGERLAASYVNFYMPNGGVVMPAFGIPEDDTRAQKVLQEVFPDRKVVAVETREIVLGGGNIHCITQQQPVPPQQPGAA